MQPRARARARAGAGMFMVHIVKHALSALTRPYHRTSTASHPNCEVKPGRARLVRSWGTRLEARVPSYLFFFPRLIVRFSSQLTRRPPPLRGEGFVALRTHGCYIDPMRCIARQALCCCSIPITAEPACLSHAALRTHGCYISIECAALPAGRFIKKQPMRCFKDGLSLLV